MRGGPAWGREGGRCGGEGVGRGIEIKAGRGRGHEGSERVKQRFRSSDEDEGWWGGGRVRDLRVKEADRRIPGPQRG